jgi:hypothetical protein
MASQITKHHIAPTSRGGTDNERNIVRLVNNVHVALHQVFSNMLPHEQLGRLIDINSTALREEFKQEIFRILDSRNDYVYKNGILRRGR